MNVSEYQQLMRRLKSGDRTADQKTRQDLRDAVAMLDRQHEALIYAGSEMRTDDEEFDWTLLSFVDAVVDERNVDDNRDAIEIEPEPDDYAEAYIRTVEQLLPGFVDDDEEQRRDEKHGLYPQYEDVAN